MFGYSEPRGVYDDMDHGLNPAIKKPDVQFEPGSIDDLIQKGKRLEAQASQSRLKVAQAAISRGGKANLMSAGLSLFNGDAKKISLSSLPSAQSAKPVEKKRKAKEKKTKDKEKRKEKKKDKKVKAKQKKKKQKKGIKKSKQKSSSSGSSSSSSSEAST
eukprot:gnl/MRDRNA2_/MRDRNA2_23254_c0_seq1.p1 gnl/MRDRNA2_/MRDRNA2_23254_c0~~gnl/MRDRNA2_/MRDRNA2_23254_c0_seq1.p1  ORF type:complete len:159 (-),score=41.51 gnl/MRDRNA2_/MRDRNA2_23254_c0_seq1:77-553(-)